jgi:O-antigen ligase
MLGVNILTLSRSGWLAIFVEVLVLAILKYRKKLKSVFTSYVSYLILILLIPALYLMYSLATSVAMTTSNLNRLKLIEIALKLFKDHPLFGAGIGTFTYNLATVKWYIIEYWDILDAHGVIFKTLAETGLFGTVSFVLLLLAILYTLIKGYNKSIKTKYSWLVLGVLVAVIGGITFQMFSTSYYIAKFWFPVGLALTSINIFYLNYYGKKQS